MVRIRDEADQKITGPNVTSRRPPGVSSRQGIHGKLPFGRSRDGVVAHGGGKST